MMPPASGKPVSTRSRMVIAAVCQPLATSSPKNARLAVSSFEVKRLRIELTRKCFYLGRVDDMCSACEALAHNQIVEIELIV